MTIQPLTRSPLAADILRLCEQIVRKFQPQKIILFGSHAYGDPGPDSDVDLLVVLPFEGKSVYKAVEIRSKINPQFPLDLLARTPEQVKKRIEIEDYFMREIVEKGVILYEASNA